MRLRPSLWLALVLSIAVVAAIASAVGRRDRPAPAILEVDLQTADGVAAQLFWAYDLGFTQEQSVRLPLHADPAAVQRLRFPFPIDGVRWLRFDPSDNDAEIRVLRMQVVDDRRRVLRAYDAASLKPANHIARLSQDGDQIRITPTAGANDPIVYAALGCGVVRSGFGRLAFVAAPGVLAALFLTACLIVLASIPIARAVSRVPSDPAPASAMPPALAWLWLLALFVAVVGTKLLVMREHPLLVPFWDQWDGEARAVYIPFGECSLTWADMFGLHNEHRVFFTRLLALGELVVNRQWDPWLQQAVNAALHAFTGAVVVASVWLALGRRYLDWLVLLGLLVFLPPYAWENILEGFQSAFYFMLLFSVLGLWLTTQSRAGSPAWWLGWGCALAGVFTAAGGLLLPPVIAAITLSCGWRGNRKSVLQTAAVAAVITVIAIAALSPPLPHHEPLRAKSLHDLVGALARNLSWPFVARPWAALVLWLPSAVLLLRRVVARTWLTRSEGFVLGLGAWVVLQAAAVAYGRGAGMPAPATRYQDFLSLGLVANSAAIILLFEASPAHLVIRRWRPELWLLAGWLGLAGFGIARLTAGSLQELRGWRQLWAAQADRVRDYVAAGDLDVFMGYRGFELPYPDPRSLAMTLQDPYLRSILPVAVREPRRIEPQTNSGGAFVHGGVYPSTPHEPGDRSWGTYTAAGNPARGHFVSAPLPACEHDRGLSFAVAGYLGAPGTRLGVHEFATGREWFATVPAYAREAWLDVRIPCPPTPFAVVAADERDDLWFAFGEPLEVGVLTPFVAQVVGGAPVAALAGVLLLILAARWT